MMRYYIAPESWSADDMILVGEEAHHLLHVLRGQPNEQILVMDGRGRQAVAQIIETSRKEARVRVMRQMFKPLPATEISLILAVPREQKMDIIIQKATELGVRHLVPVMSDQGVVRLKPGEDAAKLERWRKIAMSAAKQSGCLWLPEIDPVSPLLEYLPAMPRYDLLLAGSMEPDSVPLREVLRGALAHQPRRIAALIGPEGDLTARERAAARNAGARMVSLGDQVLRSETAALYVASVLHYECSEPRAGVQHDRATEAL